MVNNKIIFFNPIDIVQKKHPFQGALNVSELTNKII